MLKYRKSQLALTLLLSVLLFGTMAQQVSGAASTGAKVELSSDTYLVDSPVTMRVYDVVAAGSTFTVYFTYDSSGTDTLETNSDLANITVTLGSDEDEWVYTKKFPDPTGGDYIGVHVTGSASGTTTDLAADYIYKQKFSDIWPQDLIIEIGISLMVVLIIVSIVLGFAYLGSQKLRGA